MSDESFLESFEKCTLPWKEWNHIAHVRMAYLSLKKYGELLGTEMIVKSIKQYNKFNSDKKMKIGYHETITRFWINEIKLNLENTEIFDLKFKDDLSKKNNKSRKIVKPNSDELELHRNYLKSHLQKNFF